MHKHIYIYVYRHMYTYTHTFDCLAMQIHDCACLTISICRPAL